MAKATDVHVTGAEVYFLPRENRLPMKFGRETVTSSVCARARVGIADAGGRVADGWGETPLSGAWAWPGRLSHAARREGMQDLCRRLADAWATFDETGHPMEIGAAFLEARLPALLDEVNAARPADERMPHLAALVCCSAFDLAVHDAYGNLHGVETYRTYTGEFMNRDLSSYLDEPPGREGSFAGRYPQDFLVPQPPRHLPAWHLVGGKDLIDPAELTGSEPDDGHPVLLGDWIDRDGLTCLKIKLRGDDAAWDYDRIVRVARLGLPRGVIWLTADFNCTVDEPDYVNGILDRLLADEPRIYGMVLYVEQPFPYELEDHRIDVHSVSARKPLFMDESAHDWRLVRLGRSLGWTGVALKTCKTQTGALLSLCWAKAAGMTLMVQDLTNPMLAMIPHALLAAHAGTIMGLETNACQFCPDASADEQRVQPGLYRRRGGAIDLATVRGSGFGYRLDEIGRELPPPAVRAGQLA